MRYSRLFVVGIVMAFLPGCAGCGRDEVVIKDQRPEATPASTVVVTPAAPATTTPAPGPTVNINK